MSAVQPFVVAADSIIATDIGPSVAADLQADAKVVLVDNSGHLVTAKIHACEAATASASRFLTAAGDLLLPTKSSVITRTGPQRAGDLLAATRAARTRPRLEVARPTDLPRTKSRRLTRPTMHRALSALDSAVALFPAGLDLHDEAGRLLDRCGVAWTEHHDDRWDALVFESPGASSASDDLAGQAEVIEVMRAWLDGAIRLRLEDSAARRRLLGGLIAECRRFEVSWVPGYSPVEAHVRLMADPDGWPAFVDIDHAADAGDVPAVRLSLGQPGSLICGLALIRGGEA